MLVSTKSAHCPYTYIFIIDKMYSGRDEMASRPVVWRPCSAPETVEPASTARCWNLRSFFKFQVDLNALLLIYFSSGRRFLRLSSIHTRQQRLVTGQRNVQTWPAPCSAQARAKSTGLRKAVARWAWHTYLRCTLLKQESDQHISAVLMAGQLTACCD